MNYHKPDVTPKSYFPPKPIPKCERCGGHAPLQTCRVCGPTQQTDDPRSESCPARAQPRSD